MKNKTSIAIIIVISVVIILCGSVLWHGNEKNGGNKEQSYAQGLNREPSETGIPDAAITVLENAEDYSIEKSEEYEKYKDTEEISLQNVTQQDIDAIAELDNLKRLDIVISGEDIDLSLLGNLKGLRELSITFATGDKADLTFLKELPHLTDITIDRCCEVDDLSLFENMPYLQNLFLEYVEDVDLNYLTDCTGLRALHIVGGHIRNAEGLSDLLNLKEIYLFDNNNYWQEEEKMPLSLYAFGNMTELEWMLLAHIDITDISPLSGSPNLCNIILVNTRIDNIQPLSNLPNLCDLQIYGNRSEIVKEQAELYFNHVENVIVTEEIPNLLSL